LTYSDFLSAQSKDLIAMIHLPALPGTPRHQLSPEEILSQAVAEARLYQECGVKTVMIENMHDVPYTRQVGPEVSTLMAIIGREVKRLGLFCGVQVLAGCNQEALAIAHSGGLDFARVEGFVFSHVGDEGWLDACAGELLRYRKTIGAENILVFTDIKKKHSSHAVTADLDLAEIAHAAHFFLSDGVIVTGSSTGHPADCAELRSLARVPMRKLIGSGITAENLEQFFPLADAFIVGSSLKREGNWQNAPDPVRVRTLVDRFEELRSPA
jgi:membrane complex biogenesis BtpA family protein